MTGIEILPSFYIRLRGRDGMLKTYVNPATSFPPVVILPVKKLQKSSDNRNFPNNEKMKDLQQHPSP